MFIAINIWTNRNNIKNIFKNWITKVLHNYNRLSTNNVEEPTDMNQIDNIVDDKIRRNITCTIVDM